MSRKFNKKGILIISVVIFLSSYLIGFKLITDFFQSKNTEKKQEIKIESEVENPKSLISQLNRKKDIYISTENAESIKVEIPHWDEIRLIFKDFSKIREVDKLEPIYEGYSDDGIRFETDLNFFRIYTVNREEFYKVPVTEKEEFEKMLSESVYTSFDFVKQYKTWESVKISDGEKTKKLSKWNFDELSYKLISKRIVGKVQPEKNMQRSKYNFFITIEGNGYLATIETMGPDYVKITSDKGEAYYEVPKILFNYLKEEIFEIEE